VLGTYEGLHAVLNLEIVRDHYRVLLVDIEIQEHGRVINVRLVVPLGVQILLEVYNFGISLHLRLEVLLQVIQVTFLHLVCMHGYFVNLPITHEVDFITDLMNVLQEGLQGLF